MDKVERRRLLMDEIPPEKLCASLVRMDHASSGLIDNGVAYWDATAFACPEVAVGVRNLERCMKVFAQVSKDYSVPNKDVPWDIASKPVAWQRANMILHVSDFFTSAQVETRVLLAMMLVAKGAEAHLSLSGLQRSPGKHWREYTGVHAEAYKRLAQELLDECGINPEKLAQVDLETAIAGYLSISYSERKPVQSLLEDAVTELEPELKTAMRAGTSNEVYSKLAEKYPGFRNGILNMPSMFWSANKILGSDFRDQLKNHGKNYFPQVEDVWTRELLTLALFFSLDIQSSKTANPDNPSDEAMAIMHCLGIDSEGRVWENGYQGEIDTSDPRGTKPVDFKYVLKALIDPESMLLA